MNKFKNAVLFLALTNLLAIAGVVGWLWSSGRLNIDRARQIREMLTPTIAEQAAKDAELAAKEKAEGIAAAEKIRRSGAPESSVERIEAARDARDLLEQERTRLREEARQLQVLLDGKRGELEGLNKEVAAARAALADARKQFEDTVGSEQFAMAVAGLQAQKPKDAASVLSSLLNDPAPNEADQPMHAKQQRALVVKYLVAMDEEVRGKVLAEFVKTDAKLAADLLEAIRLRGAPGVAAGG